MIEKLLKFQIKYSLFIFIFLFIFIAFGAYTAKDLKIDSDFGKLVPADSQYNTNNRILTNTFESNDAVVIFITKDEKSILKKQVSNMRDKSIQNYIHEIKNTLSESQYVVKTSEGILSSDYNGIEIIVFLRVPNRVGSLKDVKKELEFYLNEVGSPPGIRTSLTGFPVLIDRVSTLLIEDNLRTIFITLIFIFLILFWFYRDIYFTLITIAVPITSLIMLAALMVILNINVTITLAAVGVLILGLGADYSIHISTHYHNAREKYKDHTKALIYTINQLKLPITASFITTFAGFVALILGVSPSSQNQGIVLAMGILIIFLTTFILFPVLISLFSNKISLKTNYIFEKLLSILGNLAVYQIKYAKAIVWMIVVITMFMIYGASQVQFSTSNSNWISDTDSVSKSFRELDYKYGAPKDSITLILNSRSGDLRNVQVLRDLNNLILKLETIPNVDEIVSPYEGMNYDFIEIYDKITNNITLRSKFNHDYTLTTIRLDNRNSNQDAAGKSRILLEIREILKITDIYNTDISLYGNPLRFDELGDSLQNDAGITTLIGLLLVFLVASMIYASITVGLLSLIPIIIAVIWAIGLMGFFNVPFTSLSTGIISLVLGIGVDFSIHLVDSIKKYLKNNTINIAIYETMTSSGKAIFLSSLTTFIGFLALTFAQLLGTRRLGLSLAFSILSVFIVSILLIPSIMSILYKRELRKNKEKNKKNNAKNKQ